MEDEDDFDEENKGQQISSTKKKEDLIMEVSANQIE